jgi:urease accessory protein UreE
MNKEQLMEYAEKHNIDTSKGQPKLMVAYDDSVLIKNGDMIQINENTYKIIEKNNMQEFNIICDISMELVLNGNN